MKDTKNHHVDKMTLVTPGGASIEGVSFRQAVSIMKEMEKLYGVRLQMNSQEIPSKPSSDPKLKSIKELEIEAIRDALAATSGNKQATARALGISRNTLSRKMEAYGIQIHKSVA